MYWKQFLDNNGYIYSLDMIRLDIDFGSNGQKICNYLMHLDTYSDKASIKYFSSVKPFQYRSLFSISLSDSVSFALGLGFIDISGKTNNHGFLEFNPNKCEPFSFFGEIRSFIYSLCDSVSLVRFDLAIDLPFSRHNVKLIRHNKKLYSYLIKDNGVTEYSGRRSNNGFIKLYDKTVESGLDYPLTRLEITLDASADIDSCFPEVWIYDNQYKLMLDNTLSNTQKILVRLIRESDIPSRFIKDLDSHTRAKIKPFLYDKILCCCDASWLQIKLLAFSYIKSH